MATLFISDLHLDQSRPAVTGLFLQFLRAQATQAEALYILGDLFEALVGDDEDGDLATAVRGGLRQLVASGVPVFVMRGNRDFLLGPGFAAETCAQLLPDPCVIRLHDEPTLLMHGDLLCSDDASYLAFRAQVRDPAWQQHFLAQPLPARWAFAETARAGSQQHQGSLREAGELESITDVNPQTVDDVMRLFGVNRLIHGHTHRPAFHPLRRGQVTALRIVLGDWHEQGSVLTATRDGMELSTLPQGLL